MQDSEGLLEQRSAHPTFNRGERGFESRTGHMKDYHSFTVEPEQLHLPVYRTGRSLGFTLYEDDQYIGTMKDPETADRIAEELNRLEDLKHQKGNRG